MVVNARGGLSVLTVGGITDPHVWLDPMLARVQVDAIAGGLEQADPAGRAVYAENARPSTPGSTRSTRSSRPASPSARAATW